MKILTTKLDGLKIIENETFRDERGWAKKKFSKPIFENNGLVSDFHEYLFTASKQNVIRGMHFQIPPKSSDKLVFVIKGEVIDVCLDLRSNSTTYKQFLSFRLSENDNRALYVPKGLAHGFKSLKNDTIVAYAISEDFSEDMDKGIRYDSFGFDWEIERPIISQKDIAWPCLENFKTPF